MNADLTNKLSSLLSNLAGRIKLGKFDKVLDELLKLDKQKLILVAFSSVIILYLDFAFVIGWQWKFIRSSGPKIVNLRNEIKTLINESARIGDLESAQAKLKKEIAPKVKTLISKEEIPVLLQFISETANKNNVSVLQMTTSKDADAKPQTSLKLLPVLIKLSISSDYHSLGKFINNLENAENFISVDLIKITRGSASGAKQDASLLLKTYVK